jgi:hypothetical protein
MKASINNKKGEKSPQEVDLKRTRRFEKIALEQLRYLFLLFAHLPQSNRVSLHFISR